MPTFISVVLYTQLGVDACMYFHALRGYREGGLEDSQPEDVVNFRARPIADA